MHVNMHVRDRIGGVRNALDRRMVDPVLNDKAFERCAGKDRLADDAMLPARDVALGVEPDAHAVHRHWPVVTAANVVLAGIHQLDRARGVARVEPGFADHRRLGGQMAVWRRAATKGPTTPAGVDRDLREVEAEDRRRCAMIQCLDLRTAPEGRRLAIVEHGHVERFHRRMRKVGEDVLSLDHLRGLSEFCGRVAARVGWQAGCVECGAEFVEKRVGAPGLARARDPLKH